MLKHIEDDGDLSIVIDTSGAIILVCGVCKTIWKGAFAPMTSEARALGGGIDETSSADTLIAALEGNPTLLGELGIDTDSLAESVSLREESALSHSNELGHGY